MTRIPLFSTDDMTPEQEHVHREILGGPRDSVIGPLRASMHRPDLADRWQKFGAILRFDTTLPKYLNELAILVTARHWNADLEWAVHRAAALESGLHLETVDAIDNGKLPEFQDQDSEDVYEFARMLLNHGDVQDDVYKRVWNRWGTVGVVELSTVIGYYSLVAMTVNVHEIPVPAGAGPKLSSMHGDGSGGLLSLTDLPTSLKERQTAQ